MIFSSSVTQIENVSSFICSNFEKLLCFFNCWVYIYLWWRWADNILNLLSTWWSVVCGPWVLICYSTAHAILLIRWNHQSMPIMVTLSMELRVQVPTVWIYLIHGWHNTMIDMSIHIPAHSRHSSTNYLHGYTIIITNKWQYMKWISFYTLCKSKPLGV